MASANSNSQPTQEIESQRNLKKRRNASHIWDYVENNISSGRIKCCQALCNKTWSVNTGNSTIASHLADAHKIIVKEKGLNFEKY